MRPLRSLVGALVLWFGLGTSLAEVAVVPQNGAVRTRIIVQAGPVEPSPHLQSWVPVLTLDSGYRLNPDGDQNGDGEPSVGLSDHSGVAPTFAWAKQVAPGDHDPVYSQYIDGAWEAPIAIATTPGDDLDPRWWQDAAGTIHAVWWRAGPGGSGGVVLYVTRPAGAPEFSAEEDVSLPSEAARNPSLAVLPTGEVIVAYETDPVNGQRRIVVASKAGPMAAFQAELVAVTPYAEPAVPEVRAAAGRVWVTWVHSGSAVGYSERTAGTWVDPPGQEPCSGPDDAGRARVAVISHIIQD